VNNKVKNQTIKAFEDIVDWSLKKDAMILRANPQFLKLVVNEYSQREKVYLKMIDALRVQIRKLEGK